MADRLEFKQKLGGVLELAQQKNKEISIEEVEQYFEEDALSKEQMDLVCDYLMAQNVRVKGYRRPSAKIVESKKEVQTLGEDDEAYLSAYLKEIQGAKKEDERLFAYLKKTAEVAKELYHPELFLGDMIQEGNVSLMVAINEYGDTAKGEVIMEMVRNGIEVFIASQTELKQKDKQIIERVENLETSIRKLSEDLGKELSIEELAIHLNMEAEEIQEILKLEGEVADI